MSYENTKYLINYEDLSGNTIEIRIKPKTYSGDIINYTAATLEPAAIDFSQVDMWQAVKALSAELLIKAQNNTQYTEFIDAKDRDYLIEIVKPGTSQSKILGSVTIDSLSTTKKIYSFANIGSCIDSHSNWGENDRWYFLIDEDGDGTFQSNDFLTPFPNGIQVGQYEAFNYTSAKMVNNLIDYVARNYQRYAGEDTDDDDLFDKIKRTDVTDFNELVRITYEEAKKTQDGTWYWEDPVNYDCNSFGSGQDGDILKLQISEDGGTNYITLATYEMLQDTTISDVVASMVTQVNNSGENYKASVNESNPSKIDLEHTGSVAVEDLDIKIVTDPGTSDWGTTVSEFTESSVSGDNFIFKGYNIGDIYKEDYIGLQYNITIRANDGLPDLKTAKLGYEKGGISRIKIIARCLQETGLKLPINSAYDIFEDNHSTGANDDPLAQMYENKESFAEKTCYQVLNEILIGFRIFQDGGEWWITRLDKHDSFNYRKFDYDGNILDNGTVDPQSTISGLSDHLNNGYGINVGRDGLFELRTGPKYFDIKQIYGRKDQLLRDPTAAIVDSNGELIYWDVPSGDHSIYIVNEENLLKMLQYSSVKNYIKQTITVKRSIFNFEIEIKVPELPDVSTLNFEHTYWEHDSSLTIVNVFEDVKGYYIDLNSFEFPENLFPQMYIKLTNDGAGIAQIHYITSIEGDKAYIDSSIDTSNNYILDAVLIQMKAMLRQDNELWWDGNSWVNSAYGPRTFYIVDEYYSRDWESGDTFSKKVDFSTNTSRDITLRIYQPYGLDFLINKSKMGIPGTFDKGKRTWKYYSELYPELQSEPKKLNFRFGDLPSVYSYASDLFINVLFNDKELTQGTDAWTTDPIVDVISDRIVEQMGKNGFILTGTFKFGSFLPFKHTIYEKGRNEYYMCKGGRWLLRQNYVKAEWVQINKSSPGTLVKEEKLFNEKPSGVDLYSDNRTSFGIGENGEGQIIVEGVTVEDVNKIVQGTIGTFKGTDLNNGEITLDHGLGFRPVDVVIRKNGIKVEETNMESDDLQTLNQVKVTIYVPYTDETVFQYRIR